MGWLGAEFHSVSIGAGDCGPGEVEFRFFGAGNLHERCIQAVIVENCDAHRIASHQQIEGAGRGQAIAIGIAVRVGQVIEHACVRVVEVIVCDPGSTIGIGIWKQYTGVVGIDVLLFLRADGTRIEAPPGKAEIQRCLNSLADQCPGLCP